MTKLRPALVIMAALAALALAIALSAPAFAQSGSTTSTNPYDISWSALSVGNDWSAQVIQSIFPMTGTTLATSTGSEATVIGLIVGQLTGFVGAIACAFVCYITVMNIHRAAETSRILGNNQSWMFVVRVGFAGILMFPINGGFSAGQGLVMQGAMIGIGMAKALYTNAIQAVGPDGIVISQPMIPSTDKIVAGLIDSELCMDLVNAAAGQTIVPVPTGIQVSDNADGGYVTYRYSLTAGNESGEPVCGSVTVRESATNTTTIAGVNVDMAAIQQSVLNDVLANLIRPQVATLAESFWLNKTASSLTGLQSIYTSAVAVYTSELTAQAESIASQLNSALAAQNTNLRNGNSGLLTSEVQQSTLGWTAAGA